MYFSSRWCCTISVCRFSGWKVNRDSNHSVEANGGALKIKKRGIKACLVSAYEWINSFFFIQVPGRHVAETLPTLHHIETRKQKATRQMFTCQSREMKHERLRGVAVLFWSTVLNVNGSLLFLLMALGFLNCFLPAYNKVYSVKWVTKASLQEKILWNLYFGPRAPTLLIYRDTWPVWGINI